MTKSESNTNQAYCEPLLFCDSLEYIALHSPLSAEERTIRLTQTAFLLENCMDALPAPTTGSAFKNVLRVRTWQACMPMLLRQASQMEAADNDTEAVLDNIRNVLEDTLTDCAEMSHVAGSSAIVSGQLAEVAVLGVLVWSSSKGRQPSDLILPATSAQDYANSSRSGKNFDISLHRNGKHTPLQVKSSREEFARKQRYGFTKPRGAGVAKTVFASTLVQYDNPRYAPEILANSIVTLDEAELEYAETMINRAIDSL